MDKALETATTLLPSAVDTCWIEQAVATGGSPNGCVEVIMADHECLDEATVLLRNAIQGDDK
jgi:hypothetical protein